MASPDYFSEFDSNPGISITALERIGLPKELPLEYIHLLTQRDGGEGPIGAGYLRLYPAAELKEANAGYEFPKYLPGLFLIGSNGGGEGFAIDLRKSPHDFVMVPFIGGEESAIVRLGSNLAEFLGKLHASGTDF